MRTIVLVLRSGKDFSFKDVELIARHINGKWRFEKPRIICLWDKITEHCTLPDMELIPLTNDYPGTWSRMQLYSSEMEKYRPFLYIDLDTVVVNSLENIFELVKDPSMFIPLEDFYQKGQLATGLAWIPANSEKINNVWKAWKGVVGNRMDYFLRKVIKPDIFWQQLTDTIVDFKPIGKELLVTVPKGTDIVCFHGKPRIFETIRIEWVMDYVNTAFNRDTGNYEVTVIIPYNKDRGWLRDAIKSVSPDVQLLLSKGDGNWPENFNKVLGLAKGKYIKYLHEDDMLTSNCIEDSVKTLEEQHADFIHGDAIELFQGTENVRMYIPINKFPSAYGLLRNNVIHSATTMYRREVFEKIGSFNEKLNSSEEWEFNLRCLKAGLKLGYCSSVLAIYRRHPAQKIRTLSRREIIKGRDTIKMMCK